MSLALPSSSIRLSSYLLAACMDISATNTQEEPESPTPISIPESPTPASVPKRPTPGFVLFTTPIRLECLEPDSRTCPICSEPFIEPQNKRPDPEDTEEWAMRVDMSATDYKSTKCCRHIFGRRCLEKHINSKGAWHNKCPLCRQIWWVSESPLHNSSPAQTSSQRRNPGGIRRRNDSNTRRQQRSTRSEFIAEVLNIFAAADGNDRIDATVNEVEQTLARLYQSRLSRLSRAQQRRQGNRAPEFSGTTMGETILHGASVGRL